MSTTTAPVRTLAQCRTTKVAVATQGDDLYLLTGCCGASGKGSSTGRGVVCRSCYRPVPGVFGTSWPVSNPWQVETGLVSALIDARCPCPDSCAGQLAGIACADVTDDLS